MIFRDIEEIRSSIIRLMSKYAFTETLNRKLTLNGGYTEVTSANMKVGDIIKVHHNERVPADMLLLYTTEKSGAVFIRTDQLDGETDWKLRKAVGIT
jgi:phospholipid-translocating ATPase